MTVGAGPHQQPGRGGPEGRLESSRGDRRNPRRVVLNPEHDRLVTELQGAGGDDAGEVPVPWRVEDRAVGRLDTGRRTGPGGGAEVALALGPGNRELAGEITRRWYEEGRRRNRRATDNQREPVTRSEEPPMLD